MTQNPFCLRPVEQKRSGLENTPKSILLKPGQSGLRPPGFSALPSSRLTTFGFTRSSSLSPVPSNQSVDSSKSDLFRPAQRESHCKSAFCQSKIFLNSIYIIYKYYIYILYIYINCIYIYKL